MFFVKKYLLSQNYSFLRDAVSVRKELRKYSKLPKIEYPLPSGLSQKEEMQLMMGEAIRGLAIWENAFSLGSSKKAFHGGLDKAKSMLEYLTRESERWGIEV